MAIFQCNNCTNKCQLTALPDKYRDTPEKCPFYELSIAKWEKQLSTEEMLHELLKAYPGYNFFGEQRLASYYGDMQVYTSFGMSNEDCAGESLFIDEQGVPTKPLSEGSYEVWCGGYQTDIDYAVREIYKEVMKRRNAAE